MTCGEVMFGSSLQESVSTSRYISPHATDKTGQGRPGQRPAPVFFNAPSSPDEEKRLNFKLKELLNHANRIMALTDKDERKKWIGIEGMMKKMQHELPYLIDDNTRLELCFEETIGGETCEMLGPLSYSQFIEALASKDTMDKHHEYIVSQQVRIGSGDHQRETLRTEDKLLMLYSALRYELEDHENFEALFIDDEGAAAPADNVVKMPHFGMEDSDKAQKHWVAVYNGLVNAKYLRRDENDIDEYGWVYFCCGQQEAPNGPIVWHGSIAALAYIIRAKFRGQWDKATQIFCLADGKTFPKSFNTTHKPVDKVVKPIDWCFSSANYN